MIARGQIYQLGDHIIGCGDCRDKDFVNKVIGENKIRQILTDPPYGVAYVENSQWAESKQRNMDEKIQGDMVQTDSQYTQFTREWLDNALEHMDDYNTVFIFGADMTIVNLIDGMKKLNVHYSQLIIWIKNQPIMSRRDWLAQHELIVYGWYKKHRQERPKSKSVLFYPKPAKSKLHPTMKPVGLLRKLMQNSTKIGEIIYDPFLGSGSTLIAAEQFKRKCIGIEVEPSYVEIIIKRWETLTGRKAQLIHST